MFCPPLANGDAAAINAYRDPLGPLAAAAGVELGEARFDDDKNNEKVALLIRCRAAVCVVHVRVSGRGHEPVVDLRPEPWSAQFTHEYDIEDSDACRTIGAAVSWLGVSGLIVPSLRHHADNLVVFIAQLEPETTSNPSRAPYPHRPGPPTELGWPRLNPVG